MAKRKKTRARFSYSAALQDELFALRTEISAMRSEFSAVIYTIESAFKRPRPKRPVTAKDILNCIHSAEGRLNG